MRLSRVAARLAVGYALLHGSSVAQVATVRVSLDSNGAEANGNSYINSISFDGDLVAFHSYASNLVPGDTNAGVPGSDGRDVFVHDLRTGVTVRVSVSSTGEQGNQRSGMPAISGYGQFVAFESEASNLVVGDTNGFLDIFVRDLVAGMTERVSTGTAGQEAHNASYGPSISADGRYVAFASDARDLVPGDTNLVTDIFVHDRHLGTTQRVNLSSGGVEADYESSIPFLSPDGRHVAFASYATNLVVGDTNARWDIFLRDLDTNVIERISVDSNGIQGDSDSDSPTSSWDGRFVAFGSSASNLVSGDTNDVADIFVRDRLSGITERISIDSLGNQVASLSGLARISADGRRISFYSRSDDLVPGSQNHVDDVFRHDRATRETTLVTRSVSGGPANNVSQFSSISWSGRYVSVQSVASNLVAGDGNGQLDGSDVFRTDAGPVEIGIGSCSGDGSAATCPCGNPGAPGRGCDNSQGTGGAWLTAWDSLSLPDGAEIRVSGLPRHTPGLLLRGTGQAVGPLGDGLGCVAGALVRLGAGFSAAGTLSVPIQHVDGHGTFHYQLWYRNNPASFCDAAAAFNTSNGLSITWP